MFVGIDWASQRHAVCMLDGAGDKATALVIAHTADGFDQLSARLGRLGDPATLPVAIEHPDGRLVDRLLEAGHPVVPVQPNPSKAWRHAEVLWGANNDPDDARRLAEYLHRRSPRRRVLAPCSAQTRALRAVVRTREDQLDQRVAASNQRSACLEAFWPGAKHVFADLHSPIALDVLARYPTPASAANLSERHPAAFLTKHGASGRRPPEELLARRRAAPAGLTSTVEVEARRDPALVGVLRALLAAINDLDRSVVAHLGEHPDGEIVTSLPPSGQSNAAQVLAQGGDGRPASADAEAVACLAGATPLTNQSGKHTAVHLRWAANKRLPRASYPFADNSRHASPWPAKVDADALAHGGDHPPAVPVLARAQIRLLWRCWIDQVPDHPTKHGAAPTLTEMATSAV